MITIPIVSGQPYWWLSNNSRHGFTTDDDVYWPTVTHYIEAKKFEGTQYEDVIRNCPTVLQVKAKTRKRESQCYTTTDTDIEKRNVQIYGRKTVGCSINPRWTLECKKYLQVAIYAKFNAHPRLLYELASTFPKPITFKNAASAIDQKIMHHTITILTRLRIEMYNRINKVKLAKCNQIRDVVIYISKYIAEMEGWDRVYPEMVWDAIYNLDPVQFENVDKTMQTKFAKIAKKDCQLNEYFHATKQRFAEIDPYQKDINLPSLYVTQFVLWAHAKNTTVPSIVTRLYSIITRCKTTRGILNKFKNTTPEIVIPYGSRWYRGRAPPNLSRKITNISDDKIGNDGALSKL